MKYTTTATFYLSDDLDWFRECWHVSSWDEVEERCNTFSLEELVEMFGFPEWDSCLTNERSDMNE